MKSWEKKFNEVALEKGREAFQHNRVSDLKRNANGYTAAVLGRQRFEVTVKIREEKPAGEAGRHQLQMSHRPRGTVL
ncbi:MAG TPA: hypothetical protein IAB31_12755 [Candidatus Choladousia intestinavium]|uniref:Uncharacterized protein n=1 Tax=Candidatus Choladousia intestinavium TaxID=2840727 RepID=A0A9D1AF29_9FIRM|nr:hypothetical protein [Candidatus Choladousia intestinavium]